MYGHANGGMIGPFSWSTKATTARLDDAVKVLGLCRWVAAPWGAEGGRSSGPTPPKKKKRADRWTQQLLVTPEYINSTGTLHRFPGRAFCARLPPTQPWKLPRPNDELRDGPAGVRSGRKDCGARPDTVVRAMP